MPNPIKHNQILDALQSLLQDKDIETISVSEIARAAGIGKGSIYYYFPSKEAILEALIERNYETALDTAKTLAAQTEVSPFARMAALFQACRDSSREFIKQNTKAAGFSAKDMLLLHQKYLNYLITELKPELTQIIEQGIHSGDIHFDHPAALSEIVLIVLAIKLDNSLLPSSPEEIESTITGLISLLEKGTGNPAGSLDFLMAASKTAAPHKSP